MPIREIKRYPSDSPEFALQTAVCDSLVNAMHAWNDNWRTRADSLIEELQKRGYRISRPGEGLPVTLAVTCCQAGQEAYPNPCPWHPPATL